MITARRKVVEEALAGRLGGPCSWGTRLRQRDGHREGLLELDVSRARLGAAPNVFDTCQNQRVQLQV